MTDFRSSTAARRSRRCATTSSSRSSRTSPARPICRRSTPSCSKGQATITAIFDISSDTATDLALTNKAIQAAEKYLPTNLTPPTVNLHDPTQSVVVTLAIYSQKLSLSRLALYATNVIAPQLEQVPGISFVNVGGLVTPAYEVVVDPVRLAAANLTLNDVINTLQTDNQRVPGGFAYEPNRQTTIDVRGDIQNLDSVRNLAIIPAAGARELGDGKLDRRASRKLSRRACGAWPASSIRGRQATRSSASATSRRSPKATSLACSTRTSAASPGSFMQVQKAADRQRGRRLQQRAARPAAGRAAVPGDQVPRHQRPVEVHEQQITIVTRTLMAGDSA